MKIRSDGAMCFYSSKFSAIILILLGVLFGFISLMDGFSFTNFMLLAVLGLAILMLVAGIYMLFDKRPYVILSKESVEILHKPAVTAENIKRITMETYVEKSSPSKENPNPKPQLKEYIAVYVNDLSIYKNYRLSIEYNKPQTPFYISLDSLSKKDRLLLKEAVKNIFGDKADLRNTIQRAGDAIANVADAAKAVKEGFSAWAENMKKESSEGKGPFERQ